MKKIIILFGHKAAVKAAKSVGLYVINILERDMLHSTFLNASKIADHTIILGTLNELEETVCGLLNKDVIGVVSFTDTRDGVRSAATFMEKYLSQDRLMSLNSVDTLLRKDRTRTLLRQINQAVVAHIVPHDISEVTSFIEQHGRSILKPISGQASEDITLLASSLDAEALTSVQRQKLPLGLYILEEFIDGEEYSVESITANGRTIILGITQKSKISLALPHCEFVEMGHTFPASVSGTVNSKIQNAVISIFDSLDIRTALGHTEVIVKRGEPYIVESHLRAGGDCIPELVERVTGYSPYKLFFMGMLGLEIPSLKYSGRARIQYYIPERLGYIDSVQFERSDHDFGDSVKNRLDFAEKEVTPIRSSFDRKWGYVIAYSENPQETISSYLKQYTICFREQ